MTDYFGAASFGSVIGLGYPLISMLGLVSVRLAGDVFDRTGGYGALFAIFAVVQLVAAAIIAATRLTRSAASYRTNTSAESGQAGQIASG